MSFASLCALGVLLASIPPGSPAQPSDSATPAAQVLSAAAPIAPIAPIADVASAARLATQPQVRRGYYARVTYPKAVEVGTRLPMSFTLQHLNGQKPRQVYRRYQVHAASKGVAWARIRTGDITRERTITVNVTAPPTSGYLRVRLELLRRDGRPSVRTAVVRIDVQPPPPPFDPGDPNDWSSISGKSVDGSPVRWNPCEPIRWAFNPNGVDAIYPDALTDLTTSIANISANTGLAFQYVGATAVVPYATGHDLSPAANPGVDLLAGFASTSEVPLFGNGVIGLGGPTYNKVATDKMTWIDSAGVVFNTGLVQSMSRIDNASRSLMRSLMTHEVLHAIGLGHAQGAQQIMYPYVQEEDRFGAGDLTGMSVHGATHGCAAGFPAPPTS